jgi:hypothetical protein
MATEVEANLWEIHRHQFDMSPGSVGAGMAQHWTNEKRSCR